MLRRGVQDRVRPDQLRVGFAEVSAGANVYPHFKSRQARSNQVGETYHS